LRHEWNSFLNNFDQILFMFWACCQSKSADL